MRRPFARGVVAGRDGSRDSSAPAATYRRRRSRLRGGVFVRELDPATLVLVYVAVTVVAVSAAVAGFVYADGMSTCGGFTVQHNGSETQVVVPVAEHTGGESADDERQRSAERDSLRAETSLALWCVRDGYGFVPALDPDARTVRVLAMTGPLVYLDVAYSRSTLEKMNFTSHSRKQVWDHADQKRLIPGYPGQP